MPHSFHLLIQRTLSPLEEMSLKAELEPTMKRWTKMLRAGTMLVVKEIPEDEFLAIIDGPQDGSPV